MISNANIEKLKNIEVIQNKLTDIIILREQSKSRIKLLEKQLKKRIKELKKECSDDTE